MAGKKEKPWKRLKVRGAESAQFFTSTSNVWSPDILKCSMPPPKSNKQRLHARY